MKLGNMVVTILIVLLASLVMLEYPWIGAGILGLFAVNKYLRWVYSKNRKLRKEIKKIQAKLVPLEGIQREMETLTEILAKFVQIYQEKEQEFTTVSLREPTVITQEYSHIEEN